MWIDLGKVLNKKGLSAGKFAKLLGKESSEVSRFFVKGYDPKFSMVCQWVEALGLKSINELIDYSASHDVKVRQITRPETAIEATQHGAGFQGKKKAAKKVSKKK